MRITIVFIFVLFVSMSLHAAEYYLQGTIQNYKIVMHLFSDGDSCSGDYFYQTTLKYISCEGKVTGNEYQIAVFADSDKEQTTVLEQFQLRQNPDKTWTGDWDNMKGKTLKVKLTPFNVGTLHHPYGDLPVIRELKKTDTAEYVRLAFLKLVNGKRDTSGKYSYTYVRLPNADVGSIQINGGLSNVAAKKINATLLNSLIRELREYEACMSGSDRAEYSSSLSSAYFAENVISIGFNMTQYCGGAHPNEGETSFSFNTHNGEDMDIKQVLRFSGDSEHGFSIYRSLRALYPEEMKHKADECDFSDETIWIYYNWYFTDKGIYISPAVPHYMGICRDPGWSVIPYSVIKKHRNPALKISLP